jgi:hypothetical protein
MQHAALTRGESHVYRNAEGDEGSQRNGADDGGCAFVLEGIGRFSGCVNFCNQPRRSGSAYCPGHHKSCHLANGSDAERRQLREIEALAKAVGGKQGRAARHPPIPLLRRLDRVARAFSRPTHSLFASEEADVDPTDP